MQKQAFKIFCLPPLKKAQSSRLGNRNEVKQTKIRSPWHVWLDYFMSKTCQGSDFCLFLPHSYDLTLWCNFFFKFLTRQLKGWPLMIWGAGGNPEKKFGGPSPGKKNYTEGFPWKKINSFRKFTPLPQTINGRPLTKNNMSILMVLMTKQIT